MQTLKKKIDNFSGTNGFEFNMMPLLKGLLELQLV